MGQEKLLSCSWETLVDVGSYNIYRKHCVIDGDQLLEHSKCRVLVPSEDILLSYGPSLLNSRHIPYYNLNGEKEVYIKFSKLNISENSIVRFANKYGVLGINTADRFDNITKEKNDEYMMVISGDKFSEWENEINTMKSTLYLYDLWERRKLSLLRKVLYLSSGDIDSLLFPVELEGLKHVLTFRNDNFYYQLPLYNNVVPKYDDLARYVFQSIINEKCVQHIGQFVAWSKSRQKATLEAFPYNMLGAIWWQFIENISGKTVGKRRYIPKRCNGCNAIILVSRSDAQYCDNCKQKGKRLRRKEGEVNANLTQPLG